MMNPTSLVLLALGAAVLLPGCGREQPAALHDADEAAAPKKLRLGFVANNANDYWSLVRWGCDTSVRQLGNVDLDFRTPRSRTPEAQQELLTDLLEGGVDGIAISPIHAETQTEFLNSIPTNILLVCADSDAEKSRRRCYIGTDNVAAGMQAAELLKAALPEGGKIVLLVGYPNAQNAKERIQGLQQGLAGSPIEILETLADDTKSALAEQNARDALEQYPDLAGMVGLYSYDGPAILTAVRRAGKAGKVKIVCFDADSDTLAGIATGDIYGTIMQKPFTIGRQTILFMEQYLRNGTAPVVPGSILIPTEAVTKGNVADVQRSLKTIFQQ